MFIARRSCSSIQTTATRAAFEPTATESDDGNTALSPENQRLVTVTTARTTGNFAATTTAFVAAAATTSFFPALALAAAESDNYEYGKVDAPIGLAFLGGVLAILTALLPIALKGGEKAFEEIRERDADTFGSRDNKDVLNRRK